MKENNNEKILITGCAGFIGMHLCKSLLDDGFELFGIDNINDYYDTSLKANRVKILQNYNNFSFLKSDLTNLDDLKSIFANFKPSKVVNLAAQAGVRYSIENPHTYIETNIGGFMNLLECCRFNNVNGLVYASSSSVYGGNKNDLFSESDNVDNPISIYAASKKANELMARTYYNLYNLKSIGLRFFTVYGPWGRPDMAISIFTKKILEQTPIQIYNYGKMERDFTYIDDIVSGIRSAIYHNYECEIYNLGNSRCESLMEVVSLIEKKLGKKAIIEFAPMQLGDVTKTYANIEKAKFELGYNPKTDISTGIDNFINWFKTYYKS
jgi:UDP-glucuronate 4-epimerase